MGETTKIIDKATKIKIIDMAKKGYGNKEIAALCNVSKYAVSRVTSAHKKSGNQYFDAKAGHPIGRMHSITEEQQMQLESWLVNSGLLTVKDICNQTAILCGTALKPQTIHNYLNAYFCRNTDYKANYILANPKTKEIIQRYNWQDDSTFNTWILSSGYLNGINVIATKYQHTHYYYFFKGEFTSAKAKRFLKLFIAQNPNTYMLFIPNTRTSPLCADDVKSYCEANCIPLCYFRPCPVKAKADVYIGWKPYTKYAAKDILPTATNLSSLG